MDWGYWKFKREVVTIMVIVVVVCPAELAAFTTTVLPAADVVTVAVPEITPVSWLSVSPVGRVPERILYAEISEFTVGIAFIELPTIIE